MGPSGERRGSIWRTLPPEFRQSWPLWQQIYDKMEGKKLFRWFLTQTVCGFVIRVSDDWVHHVLSMVLKRLGDLVEKTFKQTCTFAITLIDGGAFMCFGTHENLLLIPSLIGKWASPQKKDMATQWFSWRTSWPRCPRRRWRAICWRWSSSPGLEWGCTRPWCAHAALWSAWRLERSHLWTRPLHRGSDCAPNPHLQNSTSLEPRLQSGPFCQKQATREWRREERRLRFSGEQGAVLRSVWQQRRGESAITFRASSGIIGKDTPFFNLRTQQSIQREAQPKLLPSRRFQKRLC